MLYCLKFPVILGKWNRPKHYNTLPVVKTSLFYLSEQSEHVKSFLFYEQPQWASNHCLAAIIWMSLKYLKLGASLKCQKQGMQNAWLQSNMRLFCTQKDEYFHRCFWRDVAEPRKRKDKKKKIQLQEAHLLALLVSLQLDYLSCEMNFPTEKTDRHKPTCPGEILHKHFFSTQEKQSGSRNESTSFQLHRTHCNTTQECNKLSI